MQDNSLQQLKKLLRSRGERPFLLHRNESMACGDFDAQWETAADAIRSSGILPFEPVALLSDWCPAALAHFFALAENRQILVPISHHSGAECARRLDVAGCRWSWSCTQGLKKLATSPPPLHPLYTELQARRHSGLVLFSSGTTAEPKGMLHDFDRLVAAYPPRALRSWRVLMLSFIDHIGGIDSLLRATANGSTLVLPENRDPDHLGRLMQDCRVDVLPASPTFLNLFLLARTHQQYDLSALRIIGYGAEPMPPALLQRLQIAFPGVAFQQKFGTSETNAIRVRSEASDSLFLRIDDPATEYKVVDGELWLKSDNRILGYLNPDGSRFDPDGWFHTGDLVEVRDDAYLRIIGRIEEVINVGGRKVHPAEVEACLLTHPDVLDAQVFPGDNAITGQWVLADVMARAGADPRSLRPALKAHCRRSLDAYKVPVKIRFVDHIVYSSRFKKIRR